MIYRHIIRTFTNRIYPPLRRVHEFDELLSLSAVNNIPLVANFTAGWCPSCKESTPLITNLVETMDGKINLVEVEIDAEEGPDLALRFQVRSIPTLMGFKRGLRQARDLKGNDLKKVETIKKWLEGLSADGERDRIM